MQLTPYENLLLAISPLIQSGKVLLLGDEELCVGVIEKSFPFVGAKIDWSQIPGAVIKVANEQDFVTECLEFLRFQIGNEGISPLAHVFIIGDSAMEKAMATQVRFLEALLMEVLELPQHTYIVSLNGEWCMTFTMEGDMAFGYSSIS